jgi:hypothetical protein
MLTKEINDKCTPNPLVPIKPAALAARNSISHAIPAIPATKLGRQKNLTTSDANTNANDSANDNANTRDNTSNTVD